MRASISWGGAKALNGPRRRAHTRAEVSGDEEDPPARCIDTTKTWSDPHRVKMSSGERPIGAAKHKQPDTEALCQPPPPPRQSGGCPT